MNRTFSTVVFQNSGSVSRCQSDRRTAKYLRQFEEFNNEIQILLCSDDGLSVWPFAVNKPKSKPTFLLERTLTVTSRFTHW
jgi:hypothetical protein